MQKICYEITRVDVTQIPGLSASSVQSLISELGTDMSKWANDKRFTSWMGLPPNHKISGGQILSNQTRKTQNRAAKIFRQAASTLNHSKTALGAFFRKIKGKKDYATAITATARKIAVIFYHMLKKGTPYREMGENYYIQQQQERYFKNLEKQAQKMGYALAPLKG